MGDKKFLKWLSFQPSCLDGDFNQWDDGIGRNIPAHVRRVNRGSGMGLKPQFSAVPLTHEQHMIQHQCGESEVIRRFSGIDLTTAQAAEWFEQKADEYADKFRGRNPSATP